ncbi:unnamed protein product [Prorocentrum cordatum]|uniref:FMN-dependent dehydrogenase domain-containing protein n=1 Tax=Prorocentrum cordatum TaxID=2364126 RepID=A0ABN9T2Q8_9DINO|nr:unnamed protein product [Polarella glacialis]
METLQAAGYKRNDFTVFINGGIRRGGDIFQAVALGAAACGVGRPVLCSLASYGEKGIVRAHMLQDELQMVMRLSGTASIASITPGHVITRNPADHIVPLPQDHLVQGTCAADAVDRGCESAAHPARGPAS